MTNGIFNIVKYVDAVCQDPLPAPPLLLLPAVDQGQSKDAGAQHGGGVPSHLCVGEPVPAGEGVEPPRLHSAHPPHGEHRPTELS